MVCPKQNTNDSYLTPIAELVVGLFCSPAVAGDHLSLYCPFFVFFGMYSFSSFNCSSLLASYQFYNSISFR